jgi:hypothetical protein
MSWKPRKTSMSSQSTHDARAGTLHRKLTGIFESATRHYEKAAWRANAALSVQLGRLRGQTSNLSSTFLAMPLILGKLSPSILANLQTAIFAAPFAEFNASDHAKGYVFNPDANAITRIFEGGYRFRRIEAPQLRAMADLMSELRPEITTHVGGGWKVINLKSWSVRSDTVQHGPNAWHLDGFPVGTFKVMVYLTPIGPATGTTEVRFADDSTRVLEGEAGTYLLFDPSVLWHRGVAPTDAGVERTHIEITIMRAPTTDLSLVEGGLNSAFPRLPWTRRPIRTT